MPFDWGATAIVHRTDLAPEPTVQTLKAFADPSFAGKIGIPDMIEEVYALGFLATGVTDWSAVTDEQFRAASDFLRAVHANRPWYWVAGDDLHGRMARGEIVLAWTWSEYLVAAQKLGAPVALKLDPEEGASAWGCGFVKLANGVADDAVIYDYINAALEPRVATALMDGWGYGHGNAVAMAEMDQDRLVTLGFLDPKEMRARMLAPLHRGGLEFIDPKRFRAPTLWQAPVPADLREKMVAEWARIKSGS